MTKGDLFKGVMQWEMMTKDLSLEGRMPTFYYDDTAMTATYTASTDKVRKLLPLPVMHPVEAWSGRALVAFTASNTVKRISIPTTNFQFHFPLRMKTSFPVSP